MIKRQKLAEQFSTYLNWNDSTQVWRRDSKLYLHINQLISKNVELNSALYWSLFFHQQYLLKNQQDNYYSREHLYAYLQEACYWAVYEICTSQKKLPHIEEYFSQGILEFDELLTKFNPKLGSKLDVFAKNWLKWRIVDNQRQLDRAAGYTAWSLLLRCSASRITEALVRWGICGETLENYLLAWDYYREIYSKAKIKINNKLQKPDFKTWEQIAEAYNSETHSKVNATVIENWLQTASEAISNYVSPTTRALSLDEPLKENPETCLKNLVEDPNFKVTLEYIGEQEDPKKIKEWLILAVNSLEEEKQKILRLVYQEGLTQTTIAGKLGINQATVGRRINRIIKELTEQFIPWSQSHFKTKLNPEQITAIIQLIEEWLQIEWQREEKI